MGFANTNNLKITDTQTIREKSKRNFLKHPRREKRGREKEKKRRKEETVDVFGP
jgi:hypothetical protein